MKLLVFTQKMDMNDTVLSFFHRWVVELARHFEQVTVICLYEGRNDLPVNVRVLSLGKEKGQSRLKYLVNFYKYIIGNRHDYDAVFVHMNQEYVILGGFFWKLWGKTVFMWRNHYAGSFLTDIAAAFCTKVFCTSKFSYTAKYGKTVFMPVGIDTENFFPQKGTVRQPRSILSLGRISPSKKLDIFLDALALLKERGIDFRSSIYGDALPADAVYLEGLKKRSKEIGLVGDVSFCAGVPNVATPALYSSFDIFVNLSRSGMLDKTIFEAMACGAISVVCNKDLIGKIDGGYIFEEDDSGSLADKLAGILALSESARTEQSVHLRKFVDDKHSLRELADRIYSEYND